MPDLSLKQLLSEIGAHPASGIRRFAPNVPQISVRNFIGSSLFDQPFPSWTPKSPLAKAANEFGLLYDPGQDVVYYKKDSILRHAGYSIVFDVAAPTANIVIDCEPIYFKYANKLWMIELWKGQYSLATGCEIGVYNTPKIDTPWGSLSSIHFNVAKDDELLVIAFTLRKNGQLLFFRGPEKHWWLSGFTMGLYSPPNELTMDVSITCLDSQMLTAVVHALHNMGYSVQVRSTTVNFRFATPSFPQPRLKNPYTPAAEMVTQEIVKKYKAFGITNNNLNTIPDTVYGEIGEWLFFNRLGKED